MNRVGALRLSVILLSAAGGGLLGLEPLRYVSGDVIAACAVLAAFLVPVMLLLATVLTAGRLSIALFDELSRALDARQIGARRLFSGYIFVIFLFLIIKASEKSDISGWQITNILVSVTGCAAFASVLMGTLRFMATLKDLQDLRHRLLRREMADEDMKAALSAPTSLEPLPPPPDSPPVRQSDAF